MFLDAMANRGDNMFETMTMNKTFVEINSKHTMIDIQEVWRVTIKRNGKKYFVLFVTQGGEYASSDDFSTEQEAIDFRNKVTSGGQDD